MYIFGKQTTWKSLHLNKGTNKKMLPYGKYLENLLQLD